MMRPRAKMSSGRQGAAAVETALVLPLALLFMFGIMEYGRFVMTQQVLTNAAREGCRYAITHVNPVTLNGVTYNSGTSTVTTIINNISPGVQLSGQTVNIFASDALGNNLGAWTSAVEGQFICVQITGNYIPILSTYLHMPASISFKTQSVMIVEGS